MYSGPEIRPAPGASAGSSKSVIAIIASIACIGLLLFLIAATIILALIPIYVSNRSTAPNTAAFRSKLITLKIDPSNANDRRGKRETSDLTDFIGGTVGSEDLPKFETALMSAVPSKTVNSVEVSDVSIANEETGTGRKRRLSKRAIRAVVIIRFYIIFVRSCFYQCQLTRGPGLRGALRGFSFLPFTNLRIIKNGLLFGRLPRLDFISITYISLILPGSSSESPGTAPPTLAPPSNTTTTPMVTPSMG